MGEKRALGKKKCSAKMRPMVLFELVKGWISGTEPDIGEVHRIEKPHEV